MKKHFLVGFTAIIITLFYAGALCVAFHMDCSRLLSGGLLGAVWLISLGLLLSIAYSRKRHGRIIMRKHSK